VNASAAGTCARVRR